MRNYLKLLLVASIALPITIGLAHEAKANQVDIPSINPADYDRVIDGQTFTKTLNLDGARNVLVMNSTFRDIDDHAAMLRNSSNVTFYNNNFKDIHDVGILLRSSGSTDNVSIINNKFENVREEAINAAKRYEQGVDHKNLLIYGNSFHDAGYGSKHLNIHTVYVQASDAHVVNNKFTGTTDTNAISIRGDGLVAGNHINVRTNSKYGSGIKYYSDHKAGDTDLLTIVDNVIEGNNLHSGVRLEYTNSNKPGSISQQDWVVNDFVISNNRITGNIPKYDIEREITSKSWTSVDLDQSGSPRDIWGDLSEAASRTSGGSSSPQVTAQAVLNKFTRLGSTESSNRSSSSKSPYLYKARKVITDNGPLSISQYISGKVDESSNQNRRRSNPEMQQYSLALSPNQIREKRRALQEAREAKKRTNRRTD